MSESLADALTVEKIDKRVEITKKSLEFKIRNVFVSNKKGHVYGHGPKKATAMLALTA